MLLSILPILSLPLLLVSAELEPVQVDEGHLYDLGAFGRVPSSRLQSTKGVASRLGRLAWDPDVCDRHDEHFFVGIHGIMLGHAGPMIFDNEGYQLWHGKGFGSTYNFRTQTYMGEQYLTWWAGNDQVRGHGEGCYYMLDKNYQLFQEVDAIGEGKRGDLHEFEITADNTALITIYHTIPYDLTHWGIGNSTSPGYIRNCLFQEIDLETNELVYEWSAIEHVPIEDCYTKPNGEGKTALNAWDWFHLNSVQKDERGNYLISSRYSHSLFYINGKTNETIWTLGGKNNSFEDLSGGNASSIKRQHHARWTDIGTSGTQRAITVFDNSEKPNPSRGLKILIDEDAMTTEILAEAYHPMGYISASQGSIQQLPNGNLLVGWGYAPAFTEFSPDGSEVLCDVQFAALHNNGTWSPGAQESYRVYRLPWQGWPLQAPDVVVDRREAVMHMSWNGATEVRSWSVEGTRLSNTKQKPKQSRFSAKKVAFETSIEVDVVRYKEFTLTAYDQDDAVLGSWSVGFQGVIETLVEPVQGPSSSTDVEQGPSKAISDIDFSDAADDSYDEDHVEDFELVGTYEASPSSSDAEPESASMDIPPAYGSTESYDLTATPAADVISPTAQPETHSPATIVTHPSSPSTRSSSFLIFFIVITIALLALLAIHRYRPETLQDIKQRLPRVVVYWPQQAGRRTRRPDAEEGDELESKGLISQFDKQAHGEYWEKEAEAKDGSG